MFFNQKPVPVTYSEEKLKLASMANIPLAFLSLCENRPDDKMAFWKDSSGEFNNSFSNHDVFNYADYIASILGEKPKVAMMTKNLAILFSLELGIWFQKGHSISIYDTDEAPSLELKISLSDANIFACDKVGFDKIQKCSDIKSITKIILLEPCDIPTDFKIEIVELWPKENDPITSSKKSIEDWQGEMNDVKASELAKVIFSSGTTGNPKLIPLSHQNFLSTLKGWIKVIHFNSDHRTPAYLPNAHVFQATVSMLSLIGVTKTYMTVKTDLGVDLNKIKPNLFVAVPLVLDVFKGKIITKLQGLPFLKNFDFTNYDNNSFFTKIILRWVFGRLVAVKLGLSECQWLISGGAALSDPTWDFFNDCLGIPIRQGYGMSETAAGISVNGFKVKKGSTGLLLEGIETKIDENEILHVKGPNITNFGYDFKNEHLDSDGFFCTGDRAEIDDEKFVYLKGRNGDRVKMANGKFYNLETVAGKVCAQFSQFAFSVPVIEDKQSGTLIVALSEEAGPFNIGDTDEVLETINKVKDLPNFEKIVIFPEISVENSLLTPTQKVRFSMVIDLWKKLESSHSSHDKKLLVLDSLKE
jgi:long-chain acyl-CoA synthetase